MSEGDIDFDTFVITQPPWVLVERGSVVLDAHDCIDRCDDSSGILRAGLPAGAAVVVFTDKDLAERHARSIEGENLQAATFDSPDTFFGFLEWIVKFGTPNLLFDPGDKPRPKDRLIPIEDFLHNVKRG
jgi:hypothetical protein